MTVVVRTRPARAPYDPPVTSSDKPPSSLADRIRRAVQRRDDDARAAVQRQKERAARLEAEVDGLLNELEAMGRAAQVLDVLRRGRSLRLGLEGRFVSFDHAPEPERPDRIAVTGTGLDADVHAWFEEQLGRWALKIKRSTGNGRDVERSVTLTGSGLDWLFEKGLDLKLDED
jgi:hypothetical protein